MIEKLILKKRLKEQTSLYWKLWFIFWLLGTTILVPAAIAVFHGKPSDPRLTPAFFYAGLHAFLFVQAFLLIWTVILRFLQPEKNPTAGAICFWGNILLIVGWLGLIIKSFQKPLASLLLLITCFPAVIIFTRTNRLILACDRPSSQRAREAASPCPTLFHVWDVHKSTIWLPLVAMVLCGAALCLFAHITHKTIPFINIFLSSLVFGIATGVPAILFGVPALLLKQTATPSAFQRMIRKCSLVRNEENKELVAFRWYLSHPQQPWPQGIEIWGKNINTDLFDWQTPCAWEAPIQKAIEESAQIELPRLEIGQYAQDYQDELNKKPVTVLTPAFQAVLNRDLEALQRCLEADDTRLNAPYANTGNTLLHVAALNGYTEIVKFLLSQPYIEKTCTNNDGKTPLQLAEEKGLADIIALLEK